MMNVVLRKVEKKLLEPPKPSKHEKSPPPKQLSSAVTNAGVNVHKTKNPKTAVTYNNKTDNHINRVDDYKTNIILPSLHMDLALIHIFWKQKKRK